VAGCYPILMFVYTMIMIFFYPGFYPVSYPGRPFALLWLLFGLTSTGKERATATLTYFY
jgi:hypothetical protein